MKYNTNNYKKGRNATYIQPVLKSKKLKRVFVHIFEEKITLKIDSFLINLNYYNKITMK